MATLSEMRARLKEMETRGSGNNKSPSTMDNGVFPHWNLEEGKEVRVRFLPDGDPNNTFFWVERAIIKLEFPGVKGQTDSKNCIVNVPCVEMWGDTCPILSEVRGWFKDKSLEDMGRKYWKKRSYLLQGFVIDSPLAEENTPENPIRRFIIGPQIFPMIKSGIMDPELEELPTDYLRGVDFIISKTSKGGYADYSTSKWSRRERSLTDFENEAIAQHGLFNLSDFLPNKPSTIELNVMKEMFEASVDGEAFDMDKWGQYFRPIGIGSRTGDPMKPAVKDTTETSNVDDTSFETSAPVAQTVKESAGTTDQEAPSEAANRAQDILNMIRNRPKTA